MENKQYKLVALDIDGTTVKNDGTLSNRTISVIKKCESIGIPVCLCTGRNIHNTKKIAKTLSDTMPFVCIDGSILYDQKSNSIRTNKTISIETIRKIASIADKFHLYIEFCSPTKYYKYVKDPILEKFNYGGVPGNAIERFNDFFVKNVRYIHNLERFLNKEHNLNQFLIGGEKEDLDLFKEFIKDESFSDADLRYDLWGDYYVFVVATGCNKAYGLNLLSDYFNIDIEDMIAIGDQMNDIDMIKSAGLGIAMGNANDKIKEVASYITKTNEEDGVCEAIEKFIFQNNN